MSNKRTMISIFLSLFLHLILFVILIRTGFKISSNISNLKERERVVTVITRPVVEGNSRFGLAGLTSVKEVGVYRDVKTHKLGHFPPLVPGLIRKFPQLRFSLSQVEPNERIEQEKFMRLEKRKVGIENLVKEEKNELPMPQASKIAGVDIGDGNKTIEEEKNSEGGGVPVIRWRGRGRILKTAYPIRFPRIIKRMGRDVDVEAEIVVSSGGSVVNVRIVRSSGYEEVDRVVESALRRYLFSSDPEGKRSIGRLRVHFILKPEE